MLQPFGKKKKKSLFVGFCKKDPDVHSIYRLKNLQILRVCLGCKWSVFHIIPMVVTFCSGKGC